jgi:hypothetical protein
LKRVNVPTTPEELQKLIDEDRANKRRRVVTPAATKASSASSPSLTPTPPPSDEVVTNGHSLSDVTNSGAFNVAPEDPLGLRYQYCKLLEKDRNGCFPDWTSEKNIFDQFKFTVCWR